MLPMRNVKCLQIKAQMLADRPDVSAVPACLVAPARTATLGPVVVHVLKVNDVPAALALAPDKIVQSAYADDALT